MAQKRGQSPLISIIIPNWNGKKFLKVCLDSLKKQTFRDFETIIVDNGSEDGSIEYLEKNYEWVRIVALPENIGFAGGCNRGMEAAEGAWVLLMNNDTEADPDWLKHVALAIKEKPEYSFFSTKILMFNQRDMLDGTGDFMSRSLFVFRYGQFDIDKGQYDDLGEIFSPCGASAVYKKAMLDDIGMLDEDFFAYLEDIELGFRAHLAGYKGWFIPDSKIYHIGGASTDSEQMSPWVYRQNIRNMFLVFFKCYPFTVFLRSVPSMIFWHSAHIFYVVRKRRELFPYYFKALWQALKMRKKMRGKRKAIFARKRVPDSEIYRLLKLGSELNWVQYKIRKAHFSSTGKKSH